MRHLAAAPFNVNEKSATRCVDQLFAEWYRHLLRYALRLAGSLPMAEDFVQEAFVSYYRALVADRTVECPKAYTIAAVRHQAQRVWAAQREGRIPASVDDVTVSLVAPPADEVSLIWDNLQRLFTQLSPREAEVILLRAESLTYSEIAKELGIATTSVGTLLARAIAKLKAAATPADTASTAALSAAEHTKAEDGER
ncbi:MAG: sigma-70 family RNA polymerase sigma factor [Bryobacterales bacterium]|nr:sigma-70 family RNA polymerase sigma factor [Bryobacterales bacterium]